MAPTQTFRAAKWTRSACTRRICFRQQYPGGKSEPNKTQMKALLTCLANLKILGLLYLAQELPDKCTLVFSPRNCRQSWRLPRLLSRGWMICWTLSLSFAHENIAKDKIKTEVEKVTVVYHTSHVTGVTRLCHLPPTTLRLEVHKLSIQFRRRLRCS